jgi:hypothetical protein
LSFSLVTRGFAKRPSPYRDGLLGTLNRYQENRLNDLNHICADISPTISLYMNSLSRIRGPAIRDSDTGAMTARFHYREVRCSHQGIAIKVPPPESAWSSLSRSLNSTRQGEGSLGFTVSDAMSGGFGRGSSSSLVAKSPRA